MFISKSKIYFIDEMFTHLENNFFLSTKTCQWQMRWNIVMTIIVLFKYTEFRNKDAYAYDYFK